MAINLGQVYGVRPREAQGSDTRQEIRRHDPDQEQRRKKRQNSAEDGLFDTDDSATVSVTALRAFLESFLKSLTKDNASRNTAAAIDVQAPETNKRPLTGKAAYAANAYQSTARAVQKSSVPAAPQISEEAEAMLGAEDVRIIHQLLNDLQILTERRIEFLIIERGPSFLASLAAAAEKTKNTSH